jgi:arginyl-tRNA synthetase
MREEVAARVMAAAERVAAELAPADAGAAPGAVRLDAIALTPSKAPEHGDFATNAALVLAKPLRIAPRDLARKLVEALGDGGGIIAKAEVAGPGFVNLFLARDSWAQALVGALREGARYGRSALGRGESVMVEFVSANPTGPLTIGHGRNAVLGDCLARLLEANGFAVTREYYFNDAGRQMRVLGESLRARYEQQLGRQTPLPDEGYQGEYITAIARELVAEVGDRWLDGDAERFRERAQAAIFADIERTLERLGVRFDVHFNEHSLYADGRVEGALADLKARGLVYEQDGAVWLRSTALGLSRDRVLIKSSGEPTYLLPDVAYHREKFPRVQRAIDVLGPDHIEQFPYVQAAISALGLDGKAIELVMYQWVNLRRGGEIVKMSTRRADFVTVDEVLDQVGADAFRYFMVERRADTHLDFDVELAAERSERNPVFKIQYAHARLSSILRKAGEAGVAPAGPVASAFAPLRDPEEIELTKLVQRWPEVVAHAGQAREPQEIARFLLDLASAFHAYVSDAQRHRVLSEDAALSAARLGLVAALRIVLASGLELLGISAPERM